MQSLLCETKESIHGLLSRSFYELMNQITRFNWEKASKFTFGFSQQLKRKFPGNDEIAKFIENQTQQLFGFLLCIRCLFVYRTK